jgi:glycosyl-4,4'-diaponeurosporenoate acyltransferase
VDLNNWLVFICNSILCTYLGQKLPPRLYSINNWLFKERAWEKGGSIYQRLFRVKAWKTLLPEVSDFIRSIFAKRHLRAYTKEYFAGYLTESCKAELTHWLIIGSSFFLSLWNAIATTWAVFWFSIVFNFPYIIIQRYNRPRIVKYLMNKADAASRLEWTPRNLPM